MKSKIYTRNGDGGKTKLADGTSVGKDSKRLWAYGTIDEANSHVGMSMTLLAEILLNGRENEQTNEQLKKLSRVLYYLSNRMFNCSSCLAHGDADVPTSVRLAEADVTNLEQAIDYFEQISGPLHGFVLCSGSPLAAQLHIARTVVRRAERQIYALYASQPGDELVLRFVNRSSDLLFAAARYANKTLNVAEHSWQQNAHFPTL